MAKIFLLNRSLPWQICYSHQKISKQAKIESRIEIGIGIRIGIGIGIRIGIGIGTRIRIGMLRKNFNPLCMELRDPSMFV